MYCIDAPVISKTSVNKLESVQNQVARFILQTSKSMSKVCGYVDAGLRPIQSRIDSLCIVFTWKVLNSKHNVLEKNILNSVLRDLDDPWILQVKNICGPDGLGLMDKHLGFVRRKLEDQTIAGVLSLMPKH